MSSVRATVRRCPRRRLHRFAQRDHRAADCDTHGDRRAAHSHAYSDVGASDRDGNQRPTNRDAHGDRDSADAHGNGKPYCDADRDAHGNADARLYAYPLG